MARTTFQGPVRSLGGIYQQGPATVVDVTASATLTLQITRVASSLLVALWLLTLC
jgi:hypothetical protein